MLIRRNNLVINWILPVSKKGAMKVLKKIKRKVGSNLKKIFDTIFPLPDISEGNLQPIPVPVQNRNHR
jgi:hypothetical protein